MNYDDFEFRNSDGVSHRGYSAHPWVVIQNGKVVSEHSTYAEACDALRAVKESVNLLEPQ